MIESLRAGLDAFFAFIPQLIGAIVILIVLGVVAVAAAIAFGWGGTSQRTSSRGTTTGAMRPPEKTFRVREVEGRPTR
jgi:flagellar basal body-associated protein FliL